MPRRSFKPSRRSAPKRKLVWARRSVLLSNTTAIAPANSAPTRIDLLSSFEASLGSSTIGVTVVRIRGHITATTAAANPVAARVTCYVGDNNDVDRGPDANDSSYDQLSQNRDFFLYEPFYVPNNVGQALVAGAESVSRIIDVKSSRRLDELNQTLVLDLSTFDISAAGNATQVDFLIDMSVLLALP